MESRRTYRPALRGLVCGLSALGVKAVALVWVYLRHPAGLGQDKLASIMATTMQTTMQTMWTMEILGLVSTCVALVGIGYWAIAAHRGAWGGVLILAWIASLLGVFYECGAFVYTTF